MRGNINQKSLQAGFVALSLALFSLSEAGGAVELACRRAVAEVHDLPSALASQVSLRTVRLMPGPRIPPAASFFVPPELSPDGRRLLRLEGNARGETEVVVYDVASGGEIARAEAGVVRQASFLNGQDAAVIVDSPPNEQRAAARVMDLGDARASALQTPESIGFGASVAQTIGRAGLPFVFAIRDSTNPEAVVRRSGLPRGANPFRRQVGATLLDARSLRPLREISFGPLVPSKGCLNPRSSLLAFALVDPEGAPAPPTIAVIDAAAPQREVFRHDFGGTALLRLAGEDGATTHQRAVELAWSEDGRRLIAIEKATGSFVEWDSGSRTIVASQTRGHLDSWPILSALPLSGGHAVFLRAPLADLIRPFGDRRDVFGFAFHASEAREFGRRESFSASLNFDLIDPSRMDPLARRGHLIQSPSQAFEMQNGRSWVFVFARHLLAIDARDPARTIELALPDAIVTELGSRLSAGGEPGGRANGVLSARKVSESAIRVVDAFSGVHDVWLR